MSDGQWIERGTLDLWEDRHRTQQARIAELEAALRKAAIKTTAFDPAEYLDTDEAIAAYLSDALAALGEKKE